MMPFIKATATLLHQHYPERLDKLLRFSVAKGSALDLGNGEAVPRSIGRRIRAPDWRQRLNVLLPPQSCPL
jgi:hypothetical protein